MLKVLVVDDEPKVRRGLERLIKAFPEKYEFAGSCSGAQEVKSVLTKTIPDVILTDIVMPEQDGLELIGYLKHRYQNLDFIILSGYGEFEYARKALQYQVFDFLLKPLKEEELYRVLDAVADKRKKTTVINAKCVENNYFFNLIRSGSQGEEIQNLKLLGLDQKKGNFRVAILDIKSDGKNSGKNCEGLEDKIKQYFTETVYMYTCFEYQYILIWEKEYEYGYLEAQRKCMEEKYGVSFRLGISEKKENWMELKNAYFEALDAVKQYIYLVNASIVYYETLTTERSVSFPRNLCEKIVNTIHSGNTKAVSQNLKVFFQIYREKRCGIGCLKRHLELLLQNVEIVAEKIGMERSNCNTIRSFLKNIEEVENFEEIEQVFSKNINEIAVAALEVKEWKMSNFYMKQIIAFLQEQYRNPITMEDVAAHVNLSVGYLSNYFKEKMGISLTDYLLKLRMDKAKELLTNTNEKIYRIAELTGYHNPQYFVTVFKKNTGVTPAEYRKYSQK